VSYAWRHEIEINSGQMPGTETDFTVLISETHASLKTVANGGKVESANGWDIAFYSDSALTTQLKHEIESYNAATGAVIYQVKVPSCAVGTVIYRAFGDSGISTSQADPENTWNSAYKLVHHYPDGTTVTYLDSTANNRDGTGVNTPSAGTGKINGGLSLASASSEYVTVPNETFAFNSSFTISAWINPADLSVSRNWIGKNDHIADLNSPTTDCLLSSVSTAGNVRFLLRGGSGTIFDLNTTTTPITAGSLQYLVLRYDTSLGSANAAVIVNAVSKGTANATATANLDDNAIYIGAFKFIAPSGYWNGIIDELRISSVARSDNWITSEYNNQSSPSSFYSVGADVAVGGVWVPWVSVY